MILLLLTLVFLVLVYSSWVYRQDLKKLSVIILFAVVVLVILAISGIYDDVFPQSTSVNPTRCVTYDEPTTQIDLSTGEVSSLNDLGYTKIFVSRLPDNGGTQEEVILLTTVPATSPTGGGKISKLVTIPFTYSRNMQVLFYVAAFDKNNQFTGLATIRRQLGVQNKSC